MSKYAKFLKPLLGLVLVLFVGVGLASPQTIAGYWKTFDRKTRKPTSIVKIWKKEGVYYGKVAKIYPAEKGVDQPDRCTLCKGELHDKPMLGLRIMRGVIEDGDKYKGGTIVDPRNGKEYKCVLTLTDQGKQLNLRGYVGLPLFGRTDVWYRTTLSH